ncbi:DUF4097 family beta strand repeat-containing protein [Actinomadura darangshiensis]|uniref:DUF4097 family beta strand repeat-containing protein n=1 Tax=Actinomadura darangshiensis TaxID=705336 RepID=UPI00140860FE|nr:DUF4097 family beta strand repeat-containing protein [Actinomadura darangshiensis]
MRTLTVTAVAAAAAAALAGCGNLTVGRHHADRSYTAPAGVTTLKVKTHGSRVEVTAADVPSIKVSERLRWTNEKNKPKALHSTEGNTLTLSSKCGTQVIGFSSCGVSYKVQVPRSTPVEVEDRDGAIVATGLSGAVKLHSDNGSVRATGLHASTASITSNDGSLRISGHVTTANVRSANGSVDATGLTADTLTARSRDGRIKVSGRITTADLGTANGSIDARGLTADRLTANTRDGGIALGFDAPPANVKAVTQNGSIRLRLPSGEGYAIEASASNGSKRIDSAVHQDSGSKRHIDLATRDGGITVKPAD